jgi:hypothetical protein
LALTYSVSITNLGPPARVIAYPVDGIGSLLLVGCS